MSFLRPVAIASLCAVAFPLTAAAQTNGTWLSIPGSWTVTVGAGGELLPAFEGADRYVFSPFPVFSMRAAGTPARFQAPRDGFGIALINAGRFFMGPVGKFKASRDASDYKELNGLGDVPWTIEAGLFAEYWPSDWLRGRVEVRRGFNGHRGFIAEFSGDFVVPVSPSWTLSAGPRLTLADTKATAPYFAITPGQAALSGLTPFDAKGGVHSTGAGVQAQYQWNPQWQSRAYVEYERLLGDAASSPLVSTRGSVHQVTFGLTTTYSFDVQLW